MAGSLNLVCVIGNLGKDPEMRYLPSGDTVTEFSVAASRTFTTKAGEKQEETEWFSVVCYGKLAETVNQFLRKGRKAYVQGRQRTRSWDGQDGTKKYKTELVATEVTMLDRPPDQVGVRPATRHASVDDEESLTADELPF